MRDAPITLWEEETEGWPYDGSQSELTWSPAAGFALERTRRHIDADDERFERTELSAGDALRLLRDKGCSLDLLAGRIGPVLEGAAVVSSGADGEVLALDGVRLRRSWVSPKPSLLERLSSRRPDAEPVALWSWA